MEPAEFQRWLSGGTATPNSMIVAGEEVYNKLGCGTCHAPSGEGELGLEPFRLIVNDPRFDGLPGLLETPKGDDGEEDRRNLATLRGLAPVTAGDVALVKQRAPAAVG